MVVGDEDLDGSCQLEDLLMSLFADKIIIRVLGLINYKFLEPKQQVFTDELLHVLVVLLQSFLGVHDLMVARVVLHVVTYSQIHVLS